LKFPGLNIANSSLKLEFNGASKLMGNKGGCRCFWVLTGLHNKPNACERLTNVLLEIRDFALKIILETAKEELQTKSMNTFVTK